MEKTIQYPKAEISIHAPLTGSDGCIPQEKAIGYYFNPRSPYGERRHATFYLCQTFEFQSTLPLRGATASLICENAEVAISIHAPLTGSDSN